MTADCLDLDTLFQGHHPLIAIDGPNFSGRTQLLLSLCGEPTRRCIYIGPEVYNALSGLTSTVEQELELHGGDRPAALHIFPALKALGLESHLAQHPGKLSGGEQACLAVLCALALNPDAIAIDCGLEQLDRGRLGTLLDFLVTSGPPRGTLIADNRLREWAVSIHAVPIGAVRKGSPPTPLVQPIEPVSLVDLGPATAPCITVHDLCVGYRRSEPVLKNANAELQPGRCISLLGSNGAGKSTFAKALCGVLKPQSGAIRADNISVQPWRAPGKLVAYHLQNPDVSLFEGTVLDELHSGAGFDRSATQRVEALVAAFGLAQVLTMNPLALPFPVRKRVSLAATLACPVPWYVLDEPAVGADDASARAIAQVIRTIAASGHGVIVMSHSQTFHDALAGTSMQVKNGSLVRAGT